MQLFEVNPFIRYARMHAYFQPMKKDSICYDCRFFYILRGEGSFSCGGESFTVGENMLIYLPPGTKYRFTFTDYDTVNFYVLNFDLTDRYYSLSKSLGTATEEDFQPAKKPAYQLPAEFSEPIIQPDGLYARNAVGKCVELFLEKDTYYVHRASAVLKEVLFEILQGHDEEDGGYALCRSVSDYIREHFAEVTLTNEEIAARFHYHPYHLSRLMKQHTGKTLHVYLIEYRLHMAKNYLITTNLSITQVAERAGFASYSYFIKLFRERTGLSPHKWRQAHRYIGV